MPTKCTITLDSINLADKGPQPSKGVLSFPLNTWQQSSGLFVFIIIQLPMLTEFFFKACIFFSFQNFSEVIIVCCCSDQNKTKTKTNNYRTMISWKWLPKTSVIRRCIFFISILLTFDDQVLTHDKLGHLPWSPATHPYSSSPLSNLLSSHSMALLICVFMMPSVLEDLRPLPGLIILISSPESSLSLLAIWVLCELFSFALHTIGS